MEGRSSTARAPYRSGSARSLTERSLRTAAVASRWAGGLGGRDLGRPAAGQLGRGHPPWLRLRRRRLEPRVDRCASDQPLAARLRRDERAALDGPVDRVSVVAGDVGELRDGVEAVAESHVLAGVLWRRRCRPLCSCTRACLAGGDGRAMRQRCGSSDTSRGSLCGCWGDGGLSEPVVETLESDLDETADSAVDCSRDGAVSPGGWWSAPVGLIVGPNAAVLGRTGPYVHAAAPSISQAFRSAHHHKCRASHQIAPKPVLAPSVGAPCHWMGGGCPALHETEVHEPKAHGLFGHRVTSGEFDISSSVPTSTSASSEPAPLPCSAKRRSASPPSRTPQRGSRAINPFIEFTTVPTSNTIATIAIGRAATGQPVDLRIGLVVNSQQP